MQTNEATREDFDDVEAARRSFRPVGGGYELFLCRAPEVVVSGPAGTGKSRSALEKLYAAAQKYPGMRAAIVRRYRKTLTQSVMVTFEQLVRIPGDGVKFNSVDQEYRFPNGSEIIVAGLDDPEKVLSTEFDIIYVNECTEIEETTWETLTSRLRWNHMPYQQLIGDCNPSSERHWIKRREMSGKLKMITSTHKDNPIYWSEANQDWTEMGRQYIERLMALTGQMRQRLYEGKWVAAEGVIYTEFKPNVHIIKPFHLPEQLRRFMTVDFGFTNPFVAQWWAEDYDGRLYLYRELYGTQRAVEDWAHDIYELSKDEEISAIICDHDAEDRATLERHMLHGVDDCYAGRDKDFHKVPKKSRGTIGADKRRESVRAGIEQVQQRMKLAGDGRPRIFFFEDCRANDPDDNLVANKKPTCTVEELDSYVWDTVSSGRLGERTLESPRKVDDHGMDAMRYMIRYIDGNSNVPSSIWGARAKNTYGARDPVSKDDAASLLWGHKVVTGNGDDFWN